MSITRSCLLVLLSGALALSGCPKKEGKGGGAKPGTTATKPGVKPAATGGGTTFVKKAYAKDTVITQSQRMEMSFDMTVKAGGKEQKMSMQSAKSEKRKITVLAADDKKATKAKVAYIEGEETQSRNGKTRKKPNPLVGKTFIVESKEGKLVVTDEAGKPADAALASQVANDMKGSIGKPNEFAAFIPARALKVGETLEPSADVIKRMFGGKDKADVKVKTVKFVFKGAEAGVGTFDVNMELGMGRGPMSMSMKLTGTAKIQVATSWPVSLEATGPINISGGPAMTGTGKFKIAMGNGYGK